MWNLNVASSKRNILILGFVGFSFLVVGLYTTVTSFNNVIKKINMNIESLGDCSLFQNNNVSTALDKIISDKALPLAASSAIVANTSLYNQNSLRQAAATGNLSNSIFVNKKDDASLSYVNGAPPKSSFSSLKNTSLPKPTSSLGQLKGTETRPASIFDAEAMNIISQVAPTNDQLDTYIKNLIQITAQTGTVAPVNTRELQFFAEQAGSNLFSRLDSIGRVTTNLSTRTDPESRNLFILLNNIQNSILPS
jgi:hypothetical protein